MVKRLELPLGAGDLRVEALADDLVSIRWTDFLLGQLCEVEATIDDVLRWQQLGGLPAGLIVRRWMMAELDECIDRLLDRQDQLRSTPPS